MPNHYPANESTPLISSDVNGEEETVERARREFEEEMERQAPGTTFAHLVLRKPITVIISLFLIALLAIAAISVWAIQSSSLPDKAMNVPNINLVNAEIGQISDGEIEIRSNISVNIDYNRMDLRDETVQSAIEYVARKFGQVEISFDGPLHAYTKPSAKDEFSYLVSTEVKESMQVKLEPQSDQNLTVVGVLTDVGKPQVIGSLVRNILKNEPIVFRVEGNVTVSKWRMSIRVPFIYEDSFTLSKSTTDELAEISRVTVAQQELHSLNVTTLANATIENLPVSASFPAFEWDLKIPGCTHKGVTPIEHAFRGANLPFKLLHGSPASIDILFQSVVNSIPQQITDSCADATFSKSPLDNFIAKYLSGELTTFYISGVHDPKKPRILNKLLTGYDVPYTVFGKSASEKLIRGVTLEQVSFANQPKLPGPHSTRSVSFNGRALVDVVLPRFLDMQTTSAILVTGARGVIQLFDANRVHFGQVLANPSGDGKSSWLETISLAGPDGYKVTCFFDEVPMDVTDSEALSGVTREIFLRGHAPIYYDAVVDIRFETTVGGFETKSVRIKGKTEMYA